MKRTSFVSSEVSIPAKSPGLSSTGPEVILNPTPSSFAMILLKVVLPNPGGPCRRVWSSDSPRYFAASTNTRRFSTIFCCPLKSSKLGGRRAFSNSFSPAVSCFSLMSKSSFIYSTFLLFAKLVSLDSFHTMLFKEVVILVFVTVEDVDVYIAMNTAYSTVWT